MTNPTEKKIICLIVVSARGKKEVDSALCTATKPIINKTIHIIYMLYGRNLNIK